MTKVQLWPADDGACGLYRMRYPCWALQDQGYDVSLGEGSPCGPMALAQRTPGGGMRVSSDFDPGCDVMVFQRPAGTRIVPIIEWVKDKGIEVVVEIDDNFQALLPSNQAYWIYKAAKDQDIGLIAEACRLADRVVASTPALAKVYGADYVVPNCIPASYLDVPRVDGDGLLGWTGTLSVHRDDLKVVGVGVAEALKRTGWTFKVVGESGGVGHELHLDADPPETGWLPIDEYVSYMARFGVGIAPLADTAFNRSKSWLKALEYAALGVPAVVSDMPEYRRLGYGLFANERSRSWRGALVKLMSEPSLRAEMIAEGRELARMWTYENKAKDFWSAWSGE